MITATLLAYPGSATPKRHLTLADDIGFAEFGDPTAMGSVEALTWSPDRRLVAVHVGRAVIATGKVESELRIYDAASIERFAKATRPLAAPEPIWTIVRSTNREGPIIHAIRWSRDGSTIGFLEKTAQGTDRLVLGRVGDHRLTYATPTEQDVTAFDIADLANFVFAVRDTSGIEAQRTGSKAALSIVSQSLLDLIFPVSLYPANARFFERSLLFAKTDGRLRQLRDSLTREPLIVFDEGLENLRISPNGQYVLTALPVPQVPTSWDKNYLTYGDLEGHPIAGVQNLDVTSGNFVTERYAILDLRKDRTIIPTDAPTGRSLRWWTIVPPTWSADSSSLILPSAFADHETSADQPKPPCVAVFDLVPTSFSCLAPLSSLRRTGTDNSIKIKQLQDVHFTSDGRRITIETSATQGAKRNFERDALLHWAEDTVLRKNANEAPFELAIAETLSDRPVLVARMKGIRDKPLWDPNPAFAAIDLGAARRTDWQGPSGEHFRGVLYLPPDYDPRHRYPLVMQTHEGDEKKFDLNGSYHTSYSARLLAASGIIVLEARCEKGAQAMADEGQCQVELYKSAIRALSDQGLIDAGRVGAIGFSRTCFYVLKALTTEPHMFKAVSLTDGINAGYWQTILNVNRNGNLIEADNEVHNHGHPWGAGLKSWMERSPMFNADKIDAPVQLFALGPLSLALMWEPYALLRYQGKPVDFSLLDTGEHVLSGPAARLASQGMTVDWMRFWLQGYEDPDPTKVEQYRRWEALCDAQIAQKYGEPTLCVTSERAARPNQKPN
jgi:dipeptidyl aminopeptidase/acylaminoacyl peptidase